MPRQLDRQRLRFAIDMLRERVHDRHPEAGEVRGIARDERETVCQRRGRDLFVDRVFRMRYTQAAPYLSLVMREIQNVVGEVIQHRREPCVELIGLPRVAAVPDRFYAAANFADGDDTEVKRIAFGVRVSEEAPDAGVCLAALAYFADNVRVNQVRSGWRHLRFW